MYDWVKDRDFLGRMKALCADLVNQLVQAINSDGKMTVKQHLVGSGAKNLITQNAKEPIDLDYNLEIVDSGSFAINDGRGIKKYVQRMFDEVQSKKRQPPQAIAVSEPYGVYSDDGATGRT